MSIASAYAELGLPPGADEADVKSAWRRLVSRWHPDRNASTQAVARMQRINQAFEQIRASGFVAVTAPRADDGVPPTADADGASGTPPQDDPADDPATDATDAAEPARTLQRKLRLTLEEAALGCVRSLRGRLSMACTACQGNGRVTLDGGCASCGGSGERRQRGWFGWSSAAEACADCAGTGAAEQACGDCGGSGRVSTTAYQLSARIPPGVRDGDWLQLPPSRARPGAPAVHLELRVELAPHPFYTLADDGSLHCTVPVDGFAWLAGRAVDVPTPEGLERITPQPRATSVRLQGLGFPAERRGPRADLVVTLEPRWPTRLNADQRILLDQLAAASAAAGQADAALTDWQRQMRARSAPAGGRSATGSARTRQRRNDTA